jgi:phage repressor protein C with HTH and peptisase S24 domain
MIDAEAFAGRLRELIEKSGMTRAELARKIGETPQLIQAWVKNDLKSLPAANRVAKLARALNVDMMWLVTGEGSKHTNVLTGFMITDTPDTIQKQNIYSDFITVPEYKVEFGCGASPEPTYDELTETLPATYRRDWFESKGIDPKRCKRVRVHGESMSPLINDGDCILIYENADEPIVDGGIYAIAYDHQLMVKRLYKTFTGLVIKSENPEFIEEKLEGQQLEKICILGRVIERSGSLI